jgi:hypothetical protein
MHHGAPVNIFLGVGEHFSKSGVDWQKPQRVRAMVNMKPILLAAAVLVCASPAFAQGAGLHAKSAGTGAGISGGGVRSTPAPEPHRTAKKKTAHKQSSKNTMPKTQ